MGSHVKPRRHSEPPGLLHWIYRALICLMFASMLGALVGLLSVFVGLLLGELAAAAVLFLFMADLFFRLRQARKQPDYEIESSAWMWDSDFDD